MRDGVKVWREILARPASGSYYVAGYVPGAEIRSDCGIKPRIGRNVVPDHYFCGACRTGVDEGAAVDPQLRAPSIEDRRVVGAPIAAVVAAGNTGVATMMVAGRAADPLLVNDQEIP